MALSISLASASQEYRPGSTVCGSLFLTSSTSIAIGSLSIALTGSSRVSLTRNYGDLSVSDADHHSRAMLCHCEEILYTGGKWTHQSGQYSWDFQLVIPTHTAQRNGYGSRCPFMANSLGSRGDAEEALPPSMLYSCHNFVCRVEYMLEATLSPPSGGASRAKSLTTRARIIIQRDRSPSTRIDRPSLEIFARHDQVAQSPESRSQLLYQAPLARFFHISRSGRQNKKPSVPNAPASPQLSVFLPRMIEVDGDFSTLDILLFAWANNGIRGQVIARDGVATTLSTKPLIMKTMKITMNQHTHVQAGHHAASSARKTYTRKTTCSLSIPICHAEDMQDLVTAQSEGGINLGKVTELRIHKEFLVVDFATSNISVEHALDLQLGFEYDGKSFEFVRKGVRIKVVAVRGQDEAEIRDDIASDVQLGQPANRIPRAEYEAEVGSVGENWLMPPADENHGIGGEIDAFLSAAPPRYMPRVS